MINKVFVIHILFFSSIIPFLCNSEAYSPFENFLDNNESQVMVMKYACSEKGS